MKASELREQSSAELQERLRALRDEWFRLRFQRVTKQLPNPLRIRAVRKDIARILTILAQREAQAPPPPEAGRAVG
jgi:large subunit ribosomal protein L29